MNIHRLSISVMAVARSDHHFIHSSLPRGKIARTQRGSAISTGTKITADIRSRSYSIAFSLRYRLAFANPWESLRARRLHSRRHLAGKQDQQDEQADRRQHQ